MGEGLLGDPGRDRLERRPGRYTDSLGSGPIRWILIT